MHNSQLIPFDLHNPENLEYFVLNSKFQNEKYACKILIYCVPELDLIERIYGGLCKYSMH